MARHGPHATVLFLAAAIAACNTDDGGDTGGGDDAGTDTGSEAGTAYDGDTYLDEIYWDCNKTDRTFWYDVFTVGWTNGARLEVIGEADGADWEETHTLSSVDYDEDGWWDNVYIELEILDGTTCDRENYDASDACWKSQTDDASTLFLCEPEYYAGTMTWSVTLYAYGTGNELQCAAWGDDPTHFSTCADWN